MSAEPESFELSTSRLIAAPPETVYRVWTTRTGEWFAPKPRSPSPDMPAE